MDARKLKKDYKIYYKKAVEEVLEHSQIILCTTTTAGDKLLKRFYESAAHYKRPFDVCIIDEAAQATEPSSWIPIIYARKLILAGDHKQLEPTIKSLEASIGGLSVTLFERMIKSYPYAAVMLNV